MRKGLLPVALGLGLAAGTAGADVLVLPEGEPMPPIVLPAKGTSMAEVQNRYGEPRVKRPTVGGDSAEQPPITRWDYDGFVVIFERDKVVDGVIPGAPPPIVNRSGLQGARLIPAEPADPTPFAPTDADATPSEQAIAPFDAPAPAEPVPASEEPAFIEAPPAEPAAEEPPAERVEPQARESAVPPQ